MSVDPDALERIALTRLPELQGPDGLFHPSAGKHGSPVRSSAIALIGLSRDEEGAAAQGISVGALRTGMLGCLSDPALGVGELGLALWAEARTDGAALGEVLARIQRRMPSRTDRLPLEDLALLVSGSAEAAEIDPGAADMIFADARQGLIERLGPDGVFLDAHHRFGGSLSPVSAQFLALHGLRRGEEEPNAGIRRAAEGLIGLQAEGGAWPGVIDTKRAVGAELYPVLTVNQIALSAIALRGLADQALEPALAWVEGDNPLGFSLVHPEEERIDHGVLPRRRTGSIARGVGRASSRLKRGQRELGSDDLILDPIVTAEDLGWLLEAWAGRTP
ncbi:MAG: hypothetical protein FGM38_01565 [Solirubrobacterales bacterium]|nr:hypothetical protein [Solirubrobacterales bacterium]